jgi:7,8-dihydropterin-6-yl-methyl-4-(beta-D-ribofuranosyl)aminobenzene 5'-phosphate synthase
LTEKDVKVVGVSPHDSCDWTIKQFRDSFGDRYREVVVGQEIKF